MRGSKPQGLSRSFIKSFFDLANLGIADGFEVAPLGEILAKKPIGVFVEPALPRTIGVGKIYIGFQGVGHFFMLGKFRAVIDGQGMDPFSVVLQPLNEGIGYFLGLLGVDALQMIPLTPRAQPKIMPSMALRKSIRPRPVGLGG